MEYPISRIYKVLNIKRRSYYKWKKAGKPIANNFNKKIADIISEEHKRVKGIYGTIRLKHHIQNKYKKEGLILNHKLIRRYKHILGLKTIKRTKKDYLCPRQKKRTLRIRLHI